MLSDQQRQFLEQSHNAVMATVDGRGRPHAVPVLCALVDGELWSSGTEGRVRTRHLDERPDASLTVMAEGSWWRWLTVAGRVTIRRGDRVGDNLRLYRAITGKDPDDLDEYAAAMRNDRRLVFSLVPERAYPGTPGSAS